MTELRHTPRLYIENRLAASQTNEPDKDQEHYLRHVLRIKTGDIVRLFNQKDGEWTAAVSEMSKRSIHLIVQQQLRTPQAEPDLWLCAAPIKKAHFDYMIEKATELGVTAIQPVLTTRTQIREVNTVRAQAIAVESAEQSDRLSVPELRQVLTLEKLLATWPVERRLIVCAEWGDAAPIFSALSNLPPAPTAFLTGPEGGWSALELDMLRAHTGVLFVRLGPRILRADTAAIAALATWQSICGDWWE